MTVIQQEPEALHIPDWVRDLASFRKWAKSDEFPSRGWYGHLDGQLWVDLSKERAAHNKLKSKFVAVLTPLVEGTRSGHYFGERMLLTNVGAGLSTEPDGMFVSYSALHAGRARLRKGGHGIEIEGAPDIVLEVISPTSIEKDTRVLRDLYWRAGVREYWLADPRGDEPTLDILKHGAKGYAAARKSGGWVKSSVFGKSFRLTCRDDALGIPIYDLAAK
jgi:Uma2 family endonuclease